VVYITQFILASMSPRRSELLKLLGAEFETFAPEVDEGQFSDLQPEELVLRLSKEKAISVINQGAMLPVVAADTIVALDGKILGKPADESDAFSMLKMLSGKWHQVYTGVTVVKQDKVKTEVEMTEVKFRELSDKEIAAYIATGEPMDKAGSYGIQGKGALLVEQLRGDYYNVVGLPLVRLLRMMRELGVLSSEGFF
jgi:septum formation protein